MMVTYIRCLGNICWVSENLSFMSDSMFSSVYTPRGVLCTYRNVTFKFKAILVFC